MTDPHPIRDEDGEEESEHLSELADGCGCTEIWEHLSDVRASD